ncbi:enoyl-CoA hydratase family protein [Rhodococcus globerulus]|uniref:enoyl-CoA hydratase family protein n=1 Tax=Rhodococcus globerulus TaxID=33008 RepID=UPI003019DE77
MAVTLNIEDGIAVVTMSNPPVNAISVADTWTLRDIFVSLSSKDDVRAVILTAEGRGFNAGIDIKEMQSVENFDFLIGSGNACFAAFAAIYRTPIPVIAAVNGFAMGLGVGLVGSCDIIVASTKARFALPEVDNGALGCASHLAKLVPPMMLRQMVLTCEPVSAAQLHEWGTVYKLTEPEALLETAMDVARTISQKPAQVVRSAKIALNEIDLYDLERHYRLEQGHTYELNLRGDGSKAREAFVRGERTITR